MKVEKVTYKNKKNGKNLDFEIVTFKEFFANRPHNFLELDYRLNFWTLLYITKGEGIHSIDYKEYNYKTGDLIVIEKNRVHSFRINTKVEGYIININEPFFIEESKNNDVDIVSFFETPYNKPILVIDTSKKSTNRQLIDILYKEYLLYKDTSHKDLIRNLFKSFICSIRIEQKDEIKHFSKVSYNYYSSYRNLIDKNFRKLKTVEEYTKYMGISTKTINLACRECADISAKQVIVNRIIIEIKRQLIQTDKKNYEISYELGFQEPANLAGFFKRYTGMSMLAFKNSHKLNH